MTTDNAQTIVDTAFLAAKPTAVEPGRIYVTNTASGPRTLNLTGPEYTGIPARKSGTTVVTDAASFLAYFTKHADADSEVYADAQQLTVTAVLDAHTPDAARWAAHRLHLQLRETDAWKAWKAGDGRLVGQEDFAEFLQDHAAEVLEPDAATMLEIAQSIQGVTKAEFQAGTRLSDGRRALQYVETVSAKAGAKGQLEIPETFVVGLVPFEGSEGYRVTAHLRYRIGNGGGLTIGYKLDRPSEIRDTAFKDVVDAIGQEIEQPVMHGTPA